MFHSMPDGLRRCILRIKGCLTPDRPDFDRSMSEGFIDLKLQRPDIAIYHFGEAISLKPENATAWYFYGESLHKSYHIGIETSLEGRLLEESLHAFRKVAELAPTAPNYFNQSIAYLHLGQMDGVADSLDKALSASPEWNLLYSIGNISMRLGMNGITKKVEQAFKERDLSIKIYPYPI